MQIPCTGTNIVNIYNLFIQLEWYLYNMVYGFITFNSQLVCNPFHNIGIIGSFYRKDTFFILDDFRSILEASMSFAPRVSHKNIIATHL